MKAMSSDRMVWSNSDLIPESVVAIILARGGSRGNCTKK